MPHIIVKHFDATLTEQQRQRLSEALTQAATQAFDCSEHAVSVALRPIDPEIWHSSVYAPDIEARADELIKLPNYAAI